MRVGKLILEVDREGFRLLSKKGKTISTVLWVELEEFNNEVREKGRFSFHGTVNSGVVDATGKVRVGLGDEPDDRERLAAIFDKLPSEVAGRKCPACGGPVIANVCKICGASFTGQQRKKGLTFILIGVVSLVVGIVLSYATYSSSGTMWLFYGPIAIGAGLIIVGLIGLIFGKRVSV